jgi:hypothetical protein
MKTRADLLAVFAAYAPVEIPEWFEHEPPAPRPVRSLSWRDLPEDLKELGREWQNEGYRWPHDINESDPPAFMEWAKRETEIQSQWAAFKPANEMARYFGWRWFYAQQMVDRAPADFEL